MDQNISSQTKIDARWTALYSNQFLNLAQALTMAERFHQKRKAIAADPQVLSTLLYSVIGLLADKTVHNMKMINIIRTYDLPQVQALWRNALIASRDSSQFLHEMYRCPGFVIENHVAALDIKKFEVIKG